MHFADLDDHPYSWPDGKRGREVYEEKIRTAHRGWKDAGDQLRMHEDFRRSVADCVGKLQKMLC